MSSLAAQFTLILTGLQRAIGEFLARREPVSVVWLGHRVFVSRPETPRYAALPFVVWQLLHNRLARMADRFQALHDRWRAGTLPKPRPRPKRAKPPAPEPRPAPLTAIPRLPRARVWLIARVGYQAAGRANQLRHLFDQPGFAEFLAAAPQAGRILRPLCHMLGIDPPPGARLPPRPRRPRPPRPRTPRPVPPADRPLQPYVRAAARAWRQKND